jgi:hypothetical protein
MIKLKYKSDFVNTKFSQFDTIYKSNRTDINVLLNKVKTEKKNIIKKNFYLSFIAAFIICVTGSVLFI